MAAHHFVVNLRTETAGDAFRDALAPWGYLLPGNASRSVREAARRLAGEGVEVIADNGYFDDIARVAGRHAEAADGLHRQVDEHERRLGRDVRRGELDPPLRDAYRTLAASVRQEAAAVTADRNGTLPAQQEAGPTRLIGAEDITMAAWLALDIEPAYLEARRDMYRGLNRSVARRCAREIAALAPAERRGYYGVASALDHNTALDAGREFAEAGLDRVAMGFGAYMADDHFSDHVVVGRRRLDLPGRLPMRYLRTALVARGFWGGYRAVTGRPPLAFHFLGLGAPIVLGLVALCAYGTPLLTFDATSPVKDAAEGTLYVSKPAPLKIRTRAARAAAGLRRAPRMGLPVPLLRAVRRVAPVRPRRGVGLVRRPSRSRAEQRRPAPRRRAVRGPAADERARVRGAPHGSHRSPRRPQPLGARQGHGRARCERPHAGAAAGPSRGDRGELPAAHELATARRSHPVRL